MPANCTQLLPRITNTCDLGNIRSEANHPRFPSGVLEDITLPGRDQFGLPVAALKSTTKAMPVSSCAFLYVSLTDARIFEDECTKFPPGTPMGDSRKNYKSLESEGEDRELFYEEQAERYADEVAQYTPPHRRKFKGIDDYHRRAENTAFRTSDNFHMASKARGEHNVNYIGHFKSRWDFDRHECAAETDEIKSEGWHAAENAHRDLRAVSINPPPPGLFLFESFSH